MSRLARMMGLGGAAALGAGLFLATPAHAAPTPPNATLALTFGGVQCDDVAHEHDLTFILDLNRPDTTQSDVTISNVTLTVNGSVVPGLTFLPSTIPSTSDTSGATISVTGDQIDSLALSVTITAAGEGGTPLVVNLPGGTTAAACGTGATTSTTGATTSTTGGTTTTTGATTSTSAGATTSTSAGATTTSTSTTLGPNDTTGTLTISPTTVAPGGTIAVSGTGFAPNTDVSLTLFSDPVSLGTVRSNASGAIAASVAMPSSVPTGAHKVEAKGANAAGNGVNLLRGDLTVRASSSTIPRTGGPSDLLLPLGIAVVSFGILAFAWRERRLTVR